MSRALPAARGRGRWSRSGAPVGGRTLTLWPDRGPTNDAVEDRTVDPAPDPGSCRRTHAALDRREKLLVQGPEEVGVQLAAPGGFGPVDGPQQIAPCPRAGFPGQVEQRHRIARGAVRSRITCALSGIPPAMSSASDNDSTTRWHG